MKIVKFLGGLGNQMFQYAFYLSLKQVYSDVKADTNGFEDYNLHQGFELESVFNIALNKVSTFQGRLYNNEDRSFLIRKLRRIIGAKNSYQLENEYFGFEPDIYKDTSTKYYWGYWQNFNYIRPVEAQLKHHFAFNKKLDGRNLELLDRVRTNNSVSLHVRRGDYLSNNLLGNICDHSYFINAINTIKVNDPLYVIFSNDIPWCKQNLILENCIYVDWNLGSESYIDMQLMSNCKHNIISNSSFSWWSAYLNPSPDKIVITPRRWMNLDGLDYSGLILEDWVAI